jgi:hypothetical protein
VGVGVGTTERAVTLPTEKGNGDMPPAGGPESPGRGERADGSSEVPDRGLDIRDR